MTDSATVSAADPFTSSLAGRRLGRYEVLARLASGGMAGVYVARALGVAGFERLFAIKVLHPHLAHEEEFITMFLDEARLAARIRHPNVVPTIDVSDTQDAGYFLVMDYIEGDHLGALLQKAFKLGSRLPAPISMRIVVDALDGLAAAHNLTDESGRSINLVHRDISPHNIMVSTDGIARITDFGVAKAEVRLSTTREGQFKGKLAYMAPEHASNGDADQRSDLFSMGIILWESLTGRRLFRAENHAATLNKICLEPIPMPSEVDPELAPFDHVLERALARDPAQRFQSAEEFADAIEQSADALGGLANQRAVARLVKEYAAEKLSRDEELIRAAISELAGSVEGEPPLYSRAEAVMTAPPGAAMPASEEAQPSPEMLRAELGERRKLPPALLALVALVLIAAGVAALTLGDDGSEVTTSPLEPAPTNDNAEPPSEQGSSVAPEAASPQDGVDPQADDDEAAAGALTDETSEDSTEAEASAEGHESDDGVVDAPASAEADDDEQRSRRSGRRSSARPKQAEVETETESQATVTPAAPDSPEPQRPRTRQPRKPKAPKAPKAIDDVLLNPYRQKSQ